MAFEAGDTWTCGADHNGLRLDKALGMLAPDLSRSRIQKWIEEGRFALNGAPARKSDTLSVGDVVAVLLDARPEEIFLVPEDIALDVVHEDAQVIVVDKPKGMVTHPGNGVKTGTLANALAHRFKNLSDVNGPLRPGILHRLDKDTSGLLVVAKDNASHAILARQLEERTIRRIYRALAWGLMGETQGTVDQPIARNPRDPLKMGVHPGGKRAVTHWKTLGLHAFASHLEISLETGRTHQIRVHLSHIGHPVVGDPTYGGRQSLLGRIQPIHHQYASKLLSFFESQALHAHRLSFVHPKTGKTLEFTSPLPPEMTEALAFLERFAETNPGTP